MAQLAKTGVVPKEYQNPPELPKELEYLWEWFCELNEGRGSNGFAISPLSYTEILNWCHLSHSKMDPWEIKLIKKLDKLFVESLGAKS